ncbi:sarcosine oxidase subunit gamma [Methylocapsa sp. S129]|uniref:sarcosine oxidase subunit gamma n=1 Tax=Methylocapsa sp. S129 TaxID=1641869 RepID=UPI00131A8648|nr:sarcosine oxidase subunit gamma family protein [Methylocapsa sp. S129]
MPEAVRRSILDGLAMPRNSAAMVAPCPPATRFILRGGREVAASVGPAFGAAPPLEPLRSQTVGARSALWMGPDEWLLIAEDSELALGAALEAALASVPHGLIDVSHRQGALEVSGPGAARLLNAGVMLDLDISAFPVGMVARTLLTKAEIVLWRRAPDLFRVEFSRSFGPYVVAILAQAASDQDLC